MVVRLTVFPSSANLICRSTDISKYFIESIGFRDNESRLYLSSPERRDWPSSQLHWINKEMMREEVFQVHVATPTYVKRPMSLYKTRTSSTLSSFPAGAQQGLLSLLALYKFPTCLSDQTKWPLVMKHIPWVDNHQNFVTAKDNLHHYTCYGEIAI